MSDEDGYNGWKNYETWCVSMWLSNDRGLYEITTEAAADLCRPEMDVDPEDRPSVLARALRDLVDELPEVVAVTEGPASFVVDLLGAAMSEVDWREIAEGLLAEVATA